MSAKTGGPAFPRPTGWNGFDHFEDHESCDAQDGMTLRDYFAAKALDGMLSAAARDETPEVIAKWAYKYADVMLAERDK